MIFAVALVELFGYIFIGCLVVLAVVWLLNRQAFKDFFSAGRAQVGKWGQAAKNFDPRAGLDQEIRDAETVLSTSVTDLEDSKGMVTALEEQVARDRREFTLLENRLTASLRSDPEDVKGKAGEYARQLAVVKNNLVTNEGQLNKAQSIYVNNLAKFRNAQSKIKDARLRANQLGVELKQSETNAKLAKIAANFNVNVGDLDGKVSEAEAALRAKIARNNAVCDVQTDLGNDGLEEANEQERLNKAKAAQTLDEYRKKLGLNS